MRPLSGRFSGPKTKVTRTIASKFGTNMQLINLKLLSKVHAARPNRSRVVSKSLKLRTLSFENGRLKTKKHATRASVVPIIQLLRGSNPGVPERQKGKGGSFFKRHFRYCTYSYYHLHCRYTIKQLNTSTKPEYLVRRINTKK